MLEALISFIIMLIIVCVIAGVILWSVNRFFPEAYVPARYLVGACALIFILLQVVKLLNASGFSF